MDTAINKLVKLFLHGHIKATCVCHMFFYKKFNFLEKYPYLVYIPYISVFLLL